MCPCISDQIEFGSLGEGKTGEPREKPLGGREKTKKTQPTYRHLMLGFEPRPHWWEAAVFTTTPP